MSFERGNEVDVILTRCGGAAGREVGRIHGIVLNAGGEYDVLLHPAEDVEEVAWILEEEGSGLTLEDLREGPVYVLRNCQLEMLVRHGQDYR